jgi:TolA-binding protein
MRIHLLGLILLAGAAMPAAAQERIDRRLDRLEQEMQAVQRQVFPGGAGRQGPIIQPEIQPQTGMDIGGVPATTALSDLTARVDALEAQLERLTGQAEENAYRLRQMEEQLTKYRGDVDFRLNALEQARAPGPTLEEPSAETEDEPVGGPADAPAVDDPDTGDAAEDAYLVGYRLWDAGRFADAQKALEAMAKEHPDHRRASYARNLAGRAALDDGKPATAAKILLSNYQEDPKGERAADSLFFLGEALMELKKPADACKVYAELQDVYGGTMRDFISQRLPEALEAAGCG